MELVNTATAFAADAELGPARPAGRALKEAVEALLLCMAPFAPHMAEELWARIGHAGSIFRASWPQHDPQVATADTFTLVVQVNGKVRARLEVERTLARPEIERLVLADERVQAHIADRELRKVIVVPGKLVNLVVN